MNRLILLIFVVIIGFCLLAEGWKKGRRHRKRKVTKFMHVSDVHFNLFYNQSISKDTSCRSTEGFKIADYEAPYGRIGCDSPEWLLESTLAAMKEKGKDAEFILLTGDLSAHDMTDDQGSPNVLKAIQTVSSKAHEVFPDIPIFPAFGNNDIPGHYVLPINRSDPWYETVLTYWAPLILCSCCPKDVQRPTTMDALKKTFLDGGYYSANIADGRMVVLVPNAMYWNNNWQTYPLWDEIAERQLQWLAEQLALAKNKGKSVLIMSHIPPGGDPFNYNYFWIPKYAERYVSLVAGKYHDVIAGQFYAHTHKDDFRLQILNTEDEKTSTKSFVLQTASVSPTYSNNPAFKVFTMRTDIQALVDYDQHYLDLEVATEFSNPVWKFDYTFSKRYPSKNKLINANRIDELSQKLISQTDAQYWNGYFMGTTVNYFPSHYDRFGLYCIVRYVLEEDFHRCYNNFKVHNYLSSRPRNRYQIK
ncbi:cyclic GMP-AMP phosphodiesterase SMPDL3A-like [Porites lutea]|uniref:cyclic GMP-AMP phosphodiesterase SMPDL3A-like n=1 Tax=Porites lutea TaxID=51062 RepID=UPI003CC68A14